MTDSPYLSVEGAARYMGWEGPGTHTSPHPRTVSDWCASRELPATQRKRGGVYKIHRDDIDRFMRAQRQTPDRRSA